MRKTIRTIIVMIITILFFVFLSPTVASLEIPNIEYNITTENLNATQDFTNELTINDRTAQVSIIVKNTTIFTDAQFNVGELKISSENEQFINDLWLTTYIDGSPIYDGPASKLIFPVMQWIPTTQNTFTFEFFIPEKIENNYENEIFNINFIINTRCDVHVCPEPQPIFPELKEYVINKDNINQEFTINYETMVAPYDVDLGFKIKNELEKDVELTFISLSYKEKDSENDFQNINREDFIFYFKNDFNLETIPANSELSDYIGFSLDLEKTYLLNLTFKATADIEEIIPPEDNSETITEIPSESQPEETIKKDPEQGSQVDEKVETSDNSGNNYKYLILILAGLPLIYLALKKNKG